MPYDTLPAVRMIDLTPEKLLSVPCPTCGVAAGKRCLLHSGALRSEPHIDRKLSVAEAIEVKRYQRTQALAKRGHGALTVHSNG